MGNEVSQRLRWLVGERAYEQNRLHERQNLAEAGRYPTIEALARMKE